MAEDLEQQLKALTTQVEQLYKHGDKEQALSLAQPIYDRSQELPDPGHPLVASSMNNLALVRMPPAVARGVRSV